MLFYIHAACSFPVNQEYQVIHFAYIGWIFPRSPHNIGSSQRSAKSGIHRPGRLIAVMMFDPDGCVHTLAVPTSGVAYRRLPVHSEYRTADN